ncbi:MAG: PKD domain-containing protein [Nanoarchaeota archaeon]|nr:PKD domain-containing protein [Nanoarchaeota archaeon]
MKPLRFYLTIATLPLSNFGMLYCEDVCARQQKIISSDTVAGDHFGTFVDINGNYLIASAQFADTPILQNAGAAYIFSQIDGTWAQVAKLTASDGNAEHGFGSVALGTDFAAVGAVGHAGYTGAVYIFEKPATGWENIASNPTIYGDVPSGYFGNVAVHDNLLIVGASKQGGGAAYIYRRNCQQTPCDWVREKKLVPGAQIADFGSGVDIYSQYAIVGSWSANGTGAAWIYRNQDSDWVEIAKLNDALPPMTLEGNDEFGFGVSLIGNLALVAANKDDVPGALNAGSSYLFELDPQTSLWRNVAHLTVSNPVANAELGNSAVAVTQDFIAVGAGRNGEKPGSVYLYKKPEAGWVDMTETQEIRGINVSDNDRLGNSIAATTGIVVAGAVLDDERSKDAGAIYVFDTCFTCTSPQVDFGAASLSGCIPHTVQFSNMTQFSWLDPNTTYAWDFGDGTSSTEENPQHVFAAIGSYTVTLSVINSCGQGFQTKQDYIRALDYPIPGLQFNQDFSCSTPLVVTFTDETIGEQISSWLWEFGDGYFSTEQNPVHSYELPGSYSVSLTVENECAERGTTTSDAITVAEPTKAMFVTNSAREGCSPLEVRFNDESTGLELSSWSWDFGDGGMSSERNPRHVYNRPGSYSVNLTVEGQCGSDSMNALEVIVIHDCPTVTLKQALDPNSLIATIAHSIPILGGEFAIAFDKSVISNVTVEPGKDLLGGGSALGIAHNTDTSNTCGIINIDGGVAIGWIYSDTADSLTAGIHEIGTISFEGTRLECSPLLFVDCLILNSFPAMNFVTSETGQSVPLLVASDSLEEVCIVSDMRFKRGDSDNSDKYDLTDAVRILGFLFLGSPDPTCMDAADADDNGKVEITDGITLLGFLFLGTKPMPPPFTNCGLDPTEDTLLECKDSPCANQQ